MKNFLKVNKSIGDKKLKYGMRKLSIGFVSCILGALVFLPKTSVLAENSMIAPVTKIEQSDAKSLEDKTTQESEKIVTDEKFVEVKSNSFIDKLVGEKSEEEKAKENKTEEEIVKEIGDTVEKQENLTPRMVPVDLSDVTKWDSKNIKNDDINKGSVKLAKREKSTSVNKYASSDAKIMALTYLIGNNPKKYSSVGGDEFNVNTFDKWQYVDTMVFWDGVVPTPDVIDAAHRNGTKIMGTLFFNWSYSPSDNERFKSFIRKDQNGKYPNAIKLAEIANHYGFDGYFINQETTGYATYGKTPEMKEFIIQMKEEAQRLNNPIEIQWYDAMADNGNRNHYNAVNDSNDDLMKKEKENKVVDEFFMNFNWNGNISSTVNHMKKIDRSQFDAFAGLELQKDIRYRNVGRKDLLDENGKLKISLGLFVPDTVNGLAKNSDDVHNVINDFWTGSNGDPTNINDNTDFNGMARYVVDKTTILKPKFYTRFSRGNGHSWFKDGKKVSSKDWNSRSIQDVLPSWTWWIESDLGENNELKANYDYENAFNGGSSIKLNGKIKKNTEQDLRLFSTNFVPENSTVISVTYKGGKGSNILIGLATDKDRKKFEYKELKNIQINDWIKGTVDLSELAGKNIYAISVKVVGTEDNSDYLLNLGELEISSDNKEEIKSPNNVKEVEKLLKSSTETELIMKFDRVENAKYYDIYKRTINGEEWINSTSSNIAYIPKLTRDRNENSKLQDILVYAISDEGKRSNAGVFSFNWGMNSDETTISKEKEKNITPQAELVDKDNDTKSKIINDTLVDLTDKWWNDRPDSTTIKFDKPRKVVRWRIEHAGHAGESYNDGKMNAKDYNLEYKDKNDKWQVAEEVRNNILHVTDRVLKEPIEAKEWRLNVITIDNGTPWGGLRLYNWKMYEALDTESDNIPMSKSEAVHVKNDRFVIKFNRDSLGKFYQKPAKTTIKIYEDKELTKLLCEKEIGEDGKVVFDNIKLSKSKGLIYYVTQEEGKENSNRLVIPYVNETKLREEKIQKLKNDSSDISKGIDEANEKIDKAERERQEKLISENRKKENNSIPWTRLTPGLTKVPGITGEKTPEKKLPKFQYGENVIYLKGSGKQLEIKVESPVESFKLAKLDGKVLDAKNYEVKSGSTIFTLKNLYLETLSLGEYELELVFNESEKYKNANLITKFMVSENSKTDHGKNSEKEIGENTETEIGKNSEKSKEDLNIKHNSNPETLDLGVSTNISMICLSSLALYLSKKRKK